MSHQPSPARSSPSHKISQTSPGLLIPGDVGEITAPEAPLNRFEDDVNAEDEEPTEQTETTGVAQACTRNNRPWHKRPSPWWILPTTCLAGTLMFTTIAPRTELYIHLACAAIRPEYSTYPIFLPSPAPFDDVRHPPNMVPDRDVNLSQKNMETFLFPGVTIPTALISYPGVLQAPIRHNYSHIKVFADTSEPDPATNLPNIPPKADQRCSSDPKVQEAVAKLSTVMSTSLGILACLTTGWWSRLSDRYGRVRILGLTVIGGLLSDATYLLVALTQGRLPGGFRFLLLAPILDGLFGGMATSGAVAHAYLSDCSEPGSRARVFSLYIGLIFVGMAIGPALGSMVIDYTQTLLSVFYLSLCGHLIYAFMVWFIIPESLSEQTMQEIAARRKQEAKLEEERLEAELANIEGESTKRRVVMIRKFKAVAIKPVEFLRPMTIFLPRKRVVGEVGYGKSRDWNLTFLAISYAIVMLLVGTYSFKFQFAVTQFGWSSKELGYWLTVIGIIRATYLLVLLPVLIRFLTPKTQPIALPTSPSEPLQPEQRDTTPSTTSDATRPHRSASVDLLIARLSVMNEFIVYVLASLSTNAMQWSSSIILASFSGGFPPAAQSLALALLTSAKNAERRASRLNTEGTGGEDGSHEAGTLFGGLSVLSSLASQVIGPALFGLVYIQTVTTFPKAIFFLSVAVVVIGMISLFLVRLPKSEEEDQQTPLASDA